MTEFAFRVVLCKELNNLISVRTAKHFIILCGELKTLISARRAKQFIIPVLVHHLRCFPCYESGWVVEVGIGSVTSDNPGGVVKDI